MRYVVPLGQLELRLRGFSYVLRIGNKQWFVDSGIPADQVFELDWWDEMTLSLPFSVDAEPSKVTSNTEVRIILAHRTQRYGICGHQRTMSRLQRCVTPLPLE
jgi:hypothetical protein